MIARVVLLATLAACSFPDKHAAGDGGARGDGSASDAPPGAGIAIQDLPAAIQNAICKYYVQCQIQPDMATCLATNPTDTTEYRVEVASVQAGKTHYDPVQAQVCVDALSTLTCQILAVQSATAPCSTVFTGTVDLDGACADGIECKSQNCQHTDPACDPNTACCAGTCVAAPPQAAIGQPCPAGTRCVAGAYCGTTSGNQVCKAQVTAAGQPCEASDACAPPLACAFDATTGVYTSCFMPSPPNAQCDPTQGFACADMRDYCSNATQTCTPNSPTGTACNNNVGTRCVGYDTCTNNVCQPIPSLNQACPLNSSCLGMARCTGSGASSSCTLPTPITCNP